MNPAPSQRTRIVIAALALALAMASSASAATSETVLPTTMCGDYFMVEALLNGQGPYPMLLDSGAGTTIISPTISREIQTKRRVKTLAFGPFRASGRIPVRVRSMDALSHALGARIEGIIGHPVFHDVLLTYDFPRQEIRVRHGKLSGSAPGTLRTLNNKRPFIPATIGERRFNLLIDTGSGRGLTLTHFEDYSYAIPPRTTGSRMRIDGPHPVLSGRLAGTMELGPIILNQPIVNNSVSVNLVGQRILRQFSITFDQKRRRVRFTRPEIALTEPIESSPLYGIGAFFVAGEEKMDVIQVFEDSPAAEAGLRQSDQIVSIDGVPIREKSCKQSAAPDTESRTIELGVVREDETLQITIKTAVLVD